MRTLMRTLVGHRRKVALVTVALCALLGVAASRATIDNSLEVWFVHDDPAFLRYRDFVSTFGNDEVVVTAIHSPSTELGAERLQRLAALTNALQEIDGMDRVRSLANARVPNPGRPERPLVSVVDGPVETDDLQRAQQAVTQGGLPARLISADRRTLVVFSWLSAGPGVDAERPRILEELRAATTRALAPDEKASHAGMGVLYDAVNRATLGEGSLFIGLSYVVIILGLFFLTRRWAWVLVAMAAVTLADVAMFGVMALLGRPVTMFTMALPALVMVIGVANVIHITTHLRERRRLRSSSRFILLTLSAVAVPCGINAVTEAAGFSSLLGAGTTITRDFGLFGALGVLFSFALVFVLVVVALPRLSRPAPPSLLHQSLTRVTRTAMLGALHHRFLALGVTMLVVVASVAGASRLVVDTRAMDFLPDSHAFRTDTARIEREVGPFIPLELVLGAPSGTEWKDPAFLQTVADVQTTLAHGFGNRGTLSALDVLAEADRAVNGAARMTSWRQHTREDVTHLLLMAEVGGGAEDLTSMVDRARNRMRLTVFVPISSSQEYRRIAERAVSTARAQVPDGVTVEVGGYLPLNWRMAEQVVADQVDSFASAFLLIFIIIAFILRSWRLTLAALPSNVLPVLVVFGVMGWAGIWLDIATVTIAAAVLGIVVDDTVHILFQLNRRMREGASLEDAVAHVAESSGVAVVCNTLLFVAGFLVIAASHVHSVAYVGQLSAIAVFFALMGDLLLLPALLTLMPRRVTQAEWSTPSLRGAVKAS
ncbi:MAG: MMPL family transporter [Myxococcota bacterium]